MNECGSIHSRLLEAEPAELRGSGDSPVAVHVRACASCANDAARILSLTASLGRALDSVAPLQRLTPVQAARADAELERAFAESVGPRTFSRADDQAGPRSAGALRRIPRFPGRVLVPLAAVALALVVFFGDEERRGLEPMQATPFYVPPERVPATTVVNAPDAAAVVVMQTRDAAITVVWTF